jgi:hypothetical protein
MIEGLRDRIKKVIVGSTWERRMRVPGMRMAVTVKVTATPIATPRLRRVDVRPAWRDVLYPGRFALQPAVVRRATPIRIRA